MPALRMWSPLHSPFMKVFSMDSGRKPHNFTFLHGDHGQSPTSGKIKDIVWVSHGRSAAPSGPHSCHSCVHCRAVCEQFQCTVRWLDLRGSPTPTQCLPPSGPSAPSRDSGAAVSHTLVCTGHYYPAGSSRSPKHGGVPRGPPEPGVQCRHFSCLSLSASATPEVWLHSLLGPETHVGVDMKKGFPI